MLMLFLCIIVSQMFAAFFDSIFKESSLKDEWVREIQGLRDRVRSHNFGHFSYAKSMQVFAGLVRHFAFGASLDVPRLYLGLRAHGDGIRRLGRLRGSW